MPTYAPVPESFKRLSHRGEVLYLYRHILKQAAAFFDQRASQWMMNSARSNFRKQLRQRDPARLHKKLSDARKALRTIERANHVDQKAIERILRLAYGIEGKERRRLLQPFVQTARIRTHPTLALADAIASASPQHPPWSTTQLQSQLLPHLLPPAPANAPKPLHFGYERSIPPIFSPAIAPLLQPSPSALRARRPISEPPNLPQPAFKPLHGKREANLRWRYFTKLVRRAHPPLPAAILREMEFKARLGLPKQFASSPSSPSSLSNDPPSPSPSSSSSSTVTPHVYPEEWAAWERELLTILRAWRQRGEAQREARWEAGKYYPPSIGGKPAKAHVLTLRFYRRLWERLLSEVPVMHTDWREEKVDDDDDDDVPKTRTKSQQEQDLQKDKSKTRKVPVFSVSKSRYASTAKAVADSLALQALVSDFDRIGLEPPPEHGATIKKGQGDQD